SGCGELPLSEPVDAIIFNDVNNRDVASQQVYELPHANGRSVSVAADAQRLHRAIGRQRACRTGRTIRFVLAAGLGASTGVDVTGVVPILNSLLRDKVVGNGTGVNRQPVEVAGGAPALRVFR